MCDWLPSRGLGRLVLQGLGLLQGPSEGRGDVWLSIPPDRPLEELVRWGSIFFGSGCGSIGFEEFPESLVP